MQYCSMWQFAGRGSDALETVDLVYVSICNMSLFFLHIGSYFYGLGIKSQSLLLVDEEFLNIFALIALKLNHLSHLGVDDNSAIARELLLDDLEDFLLVEFLGKTLDSRQSFTTITLCTPLAWL